MIAIYNTLHGKKEEFVPLTGRTVTMYVCGVTPYDETHLGHARVYVTFDIVRRHLESAGYRVHYVQNFTDVDDKIINRSRAQGISPLALAQRFIDDYFAQMDKLGVRRADAYPRVTASVPRIVAFVDDLVKKNRAYVTPSGDVYFAVNRFPPYGTLSKRNLDELMAGARVEVDEEKKSPLDFALWKSAKEGEPAEVTWDSPWGRGRPGWHIECSVMSTKELGPTIDIHGGGQDLIFPHHENEIAQSESHTGKPFVRYWMHNGFVTVNREKMSKSLGNFFTLREIFAKYPPRVVRYFLISQHYRSPLDFSDDKLVQAQQALAGLDEAFQKLAVTGSDAGAPVLPDVLAEFRQALDDDFNTERALAVVHSFKRDALAGIGSGNRELLSRASSTLAAMLQDSLGIAPPETESAPDQVRALQSEREGYRKSRDWAKADELRKQLDALGYKVEDNPNGSSTLIRKAL